MLLRDGNPPSRTVDKYGKKDLEKTKRRTPRACDRCRLKKAKCDGRHQCRTCKASDSICTYAARRGRESRNYYSHMREITDEALQILHTACRNAGRFPGVVPKEDEHGCVSTNAILEGLGLIGSTVNEQGVPQRPMAKSTGTKRPRRHAVSSPAAQSTHCGPTLVSNHSNPSSTIDTNVSGTDDQDTTTSVVTADSDVDRLPGEVSSSHGMSNKPVPGVFSQIALFDALSPPVEALADFEHTQQYGQVPQQSFFDLDGLFNMYDPLTTPQHDLGYGHHRVYNGSTQDYQQKLHQEI